MPQAEEDQYLADVSHDVQDLIREGHKIAAIKLVRQETGLGLKEAKDRVDDIASRLGGAPSQGSAPQGRGGCLSALLVMATLGAVAVFVIYRVAI